MSDAVTPAPRERGWRRLVPALLLFLLVPGIPFFRAITPIEQTLLLLAPAITACMLIGWWAGGRAPAAVIWFALAAWMIATPVSGGASYSALARGWTVLLAAAFGLVCLAGSSQRPFFSRGLSATGIALAIALVLLVASSSSGGRIERAMEAQFETRINASLAELESVSQTKEWRDFTARNPGFAEFVESGEKQYRALPAISAKIFPALLALESLVTLALAWSVYHRISRVRIGPPLAPLREFRFNDQLVWGLVAGITALVVPTLSAFRGVGLNLSVFFGALYVLRGLGVLTWFLAPGRFALVLLIGFALLAGPFLGLFALGLGLGDTWMDWRSRPRPTT